MKEAGKKDVLRECLEFLSFLPPFIVPYQLIWDMYMYWSKKIREMQNLIVTA